MMLRAMTLSVWFWLVLAYALAGNAAGTALTLTITILSGAAWMLEVE